jgi:hypothetical protein
VKLLRRILTALAILWAAWGLVSVAVPRWLVDAVMDEPAAGAAVWVRTAGVMALVLALIAALVSQRLEDVWWWSWAFAVLEAGTATVFVLHALFGLPEGAPAWPWWTLGVVQGALAAGLLVGLADAGEEKPFV